jgi:hypothetical protein
MTVGSVLDAYATAPTSQAGFLAFSEAPGGGVLRLSWSNGNGVGRIIVASKGAIDISKLGSGQNAGQNVLLTDLEAGEYTNGHYTFSQGDEVSADGAAFPTRVIFNGTGTNRVTNVLFAEAGTYNFAVYEYNYDGQVYPANTQNNPTVVDLNLGTASLNPRTKLVSGLQMNYHLAVTPFNNAPNKTFSWTAPTNAQGVTVDRYELDINRQPDFSSGAANAIEERLDVSTLTSYNYYFTTTDSYFARVRAFGNMLFPYSDTVEARVVADGAHFVDASTYMTDTSNAFVEFTFDRKIDGKIVNSDFVAGLAATDFSLVINEGSIVAPLQNYITAVPKELVALSDNAYRLYFDLSGRVLPNTTLTIKPNSVLVDEARVEVASTESTSHALNEANVILNTTKSYVLLRQALDNIASNANNTIVILQNSTPSSKRVEENITFDLKNKIGNENGNLTIAAPNEAKANFVGSLNIYNTNSNYTGNIIFENLKMYGGANVDNILTIGGKANTYVVNRCDFTVGKVCANAIQIAEGSKINNCSIQSDTFNMTVAGIDGGHAIAMADPTTNLFDFGGLSFADNTFNAGTKSAVKIITNMNVGDGAQTPNAKTTLAIVSSSNKNTFTGEGDAIEFALGTASIANNFGFLHTTIWRNEFNNSGLAIAFEKDKDFTTLLPAILIANDNAGANKNTFGQDNKGITAKYVYSGATLDESQYIYPGVAVVDLTANKLVTGTGKPYTSIANALADVTTLSDGTQTIYLGDGVYNEVGHPIEISKDVDLEGKAPSEKPVSTFQGSLIMSSPSKVSRIAFDGINAETKVSITATSGVDLVENTFNFKSPNNPLEIISNQIFGLINVSNNMFGKSVNLPADAGVNAITVKRAVFAGNDYDGKLKFDGNYFQFNSNDGNDKGIYISTTADGQDINEANGAIEISGNNFQAPHLVPDPQDPTDETWNGKGSAIVFEDFNEATSTTLATLQSDNIKIIDENVFENDGYGVKIVNNKNIGNTVDVVSTLPNSINMWNASANKFASNVVDNVTTSLENEQIFGGAWYALTTNGAALYPRIQKAIDADVASDLHIGAGLHDDTQLIVLADKDLTSIKGHGEVCEIVGHYGTIQLNKKFNTVPSGFTADAVIMNSTNCIFADANALVHAYGAIRIPENVIITDNGVITKNNISVTNVENDILGGPINGKLTFTGNDFSVSYLKFNNTGANSNPSITITPDFSKTPVKTLQSTVQNCELNLNYAGATAILADLGNNTKTVINSIFTVYQNKFNQSDAGDATNKAIAFRNSAESNFASFDQVIVHENIFNNTSYAISLDPTNKACGVLNRISFAAPNTFANNDILNNTTFSGFYFDRSQATMSALMEIIPDCDAPAAFAIQSIETKEGVVKAGYWNASNKSIDVKVQLAADDASLQYGKIQLKAKINTNEPINLGTAYTIGADYKTGGTTAGYQIVNVTESVFEALQKALNTPIATGDVVIISAEVSDMAGNKTTSTTDDTKKLMVDVAAPTVVVSSPSPDDARMRALTRISGTYLASNDNNVTSDLESLQIKLCTESGVSPNIERRWWNGTSIEQTAAADGAAFDVNLPDNTNWDYTSISFTDLNSDGRYRAYLIATDKAGNTSNIERTFYVDNTAPRVAIGGLTKIDGTHYQVKFDEKVQAYGVTGVSASNPANYALTLQSGNAPSILTATRQNSPDDDKVILTLSSALNLTQCQTLTVTVNPIIKDIAGNVLQTANNGNIAVYTEPDVTAPYVTKIERYEVPQGSIELFEDSQNPTTVTSVLTKANEVKFKVTFSEDVKNVTAGSFTANHGVTKDFVAENGGKLATTLDDVWYVTVTPDEGVDFQTLRLYVGQRDAMLQGQLHSNITDNACGKDIPNELNQINHTIAPNETYTLDNVGPNIINASDKLLFASPIASTIWNAGDKAIQWDKTNITDNNGSADGDIKLEFTYGKASDIANIATWPKVNATNVDNSGSYTWALPSTIDMTDATIAVRAYDRIGNVSNYTYTSPFIIDNTKPEVVSVELGVQNMALIDNTPMFPYINENGFNLNAEEGNTLIIRATFNEKMKESELPTITFDPDVTININGSKNHPDYHVWDEVSKTYTLAYLVINDVKEELKNIAVKINGGTDLAGNVMAEYTSVALFNKDNKDAELSAISVESSNANKALVKNGETVTVKFTSSEALDLTTGKSSVKVFGTKDATVSVVDPVTHAYRADFTIPANEAGITQGDMGFSIVAIDMFGNTSPEVTAPTVNTNKVTYDRTKPSNYDYTVTNTKINNTNVTTESISVTAAEVGTTYKLDVYNTTTPATKVTKTGTVANAAFNVENIDLTTLADGEITFDLTLTDPSGNVSDKVTKTATKDVVAPVATIAVNKTVVNSVDKAVTVTVTYNEAMDKTTYPSIAAVNADNFNHPNYDVSNWDGDGKVFTVILTHDATSEPAMGSDPSYLDLTFKVVQDDGATDLTGNTIAEEKTSDNIQLDTRRPVPTVKLATGQTESARGGVAEFEVTFDEAIKSTGAQDDIFYGFNDVSVVLTGTMNPGQIRVSQMLGTDNQPIPGKYLVKLSELIGSGTVKVQVLDSKCKDVLGNPNVASDLATTPAVTMDNEIPTLVANNALTPANGATNVLVNTNLTLTFSENVKVGTGNIDIYKGAETTPTISIPVTDAQVTVLNNVVTINPTADFDCGGVYSVAVPAGAITDMVGNPANAIAKTNWSFNAVTGGTVSIANVAPVCAGTNVTLDATITIPQGSTVTSQNWTKGTNNTSLSANEDLVLTNTTADMSGDYKLTVTYSTGCVVTATKTVTINAMPTAPTASAQSFCTAQAHTVANLQATGDQGNTLKWYDVATDGTALTSDVVLTSKTYYVSQSTATCESQRTSVAVTVNTTPEAPTASAKTFCSTEAHTVANLQATGDQGNTLKWYDVATDGTALTSDVVLTSKTYYVSQSTATCESSRTPVVVTINTTPEAPTFVQQPVLTYCASENKTVSDMLTQVVTTGTVKVYDVNHVLITDMSAKLTNQMYHVSQTTTGCESAKLDVAMTIVPTPAAPQVASTALSYLLSDAKKVSDLQATPAQGNTIKWYDVAANGTALTSSTLLVTADYYAAQVTTTGCEGPRTKVTVTINSGDVAADITTDPTDATACINTQVTFTAAATGYPTPTYKWQAKSSAQGSSWVDLADDVLYTGTRTNTLTFTPNVIGLNGYQYRAVAMNTVDNNPASDNSLPATLTVVPASVKGTISVTETLLCATNTGATITLANYVGSIKWEKSIDNGTNYTEIANQSSATLATGALTTKTLYRAVLTSGICSSVNSDVVTIDVKPALVVNTPTLDKTPTSATFTVSATGTGTLSYQWYKKGTPDATVGTNSPIYTINNATINDNGSYYVKVTDGCLDTKQSQDAVLEISAPATVLAITSQIGNSVQSGTPFTINVESRNASGNATPVIATTPISVSIQNGIGTLTAVGSILENQSAATITVTYTNINGQSNAQLLLTGNGLSSATTTTFNVLPAQPAKPEITLYSASRSSVMLYWTSSNAPVMLIAKKGTDNNALDQTQKNTLLNKDLSTLTSTTVYSLSANPIVSPNDLGANTKVLYIGNASSVNITGLSRNTTYTFELYAYNGASNLWSLSAESSVAKFKTLNKDEDLSPLENNNFSVSQVNPNPVKGEINFTIDAQETDEYVIELFNVSGERVMSQSQTLNGGSTHAMRLDLSNIKGGVAVGDYFLKVTSRGESLTQKLVVMP